MTNVSPTVKVFVSSTFSDLRAERDELAKRTFPAVREHCENRGLQFVDVDLRWGITSSQISDGEMLRICLDEIDDCRPFFICILGDRYGTEVTTIEPGLSSRFPWLGGRLDRSVTEIEIEHAVMNAPLHADTARFFFSDSARDGSVRPDPRLVDLKDRIRRSGFMVREWSGDAGDLGQLVREELTTLIDARYPPRAPATLLELTVRNQRAFSIARAESHVGATPSSRPYASSPASAAHPSS